MCARKLAVKPVAIKVSLPHDPKYKKKKLKIRPLSRVGPVQYSPRRQSRWVPADYGGKDFWKR